MRDVKATWSQVTDDLCVSSLKLPPFFPPAWPIKNWAQNLVTWTKAQNQPQSGCISQLRLITSFILGKIYKLLLSELV